MRYRLRTLLIVLAILPPLVWIGWTRYEAWRAARDARRAAWTIEVRGYHMHSRPSSVTPANANP